MEINKNNYEAYFLSYFDCELSNREREALFIFLNQNPAVQAEFDQLSKCRLQPDANLQFPNKNALLLSKAKTSTHQEKLLLLIDNELPDDERHSTNQVIVNDDAVAKELLILTKTKFKPDEDFVFKEKWLLYKKAKTFPLLSIAKIAAIVLLVLGASLLATLVDFPDKKEPVAKTKTIEKPEIKISQNITRPTATNTNIKPVKTKISRKNASTKKTVATAKALGNRATANIIESSEDEFVPIASTNILLDKTFYNQQTIIRQLDTSLLAAVKKNGELRPALVKQAIVKNSKIKNLLKSATNEIEKYTNISLANDDGTLLISAFTINLK